MRFNILTVDEFGLAGIELANLLKNFNVYINNAIDSLEAESIFKSKKVNYNAIIWSMNSIDYSVFDDIRKLKELAEFKAVPIIIVSKFTDKKYIIRAIEAGAVEYIAKPYNEETVVNKLCRILGIPFERGIGNLLDEDILTYNFKEMLNKELKAASRGNYPLSMILGTLVYKSTEERKEDVSSFTTLVNRVFKNNLRETDTGFVYTDNSIVFILPFSDEEGAKTIQEKLQKVFEDHTVIKKRNEGYILVTCSVSYPKDGKIKHVLLQKLEDESERCVSEANMVK